LQGNFIFVNPYGGRGAVLENRKPVRESLEWLRSGGALIVFPAGDVARLNWKEGGIFDPPWSAAVGRLIQSAGCSALPVHLAGANGIG
jgi:putative hemolysin